MMLVACLIAVITVISMSVRVALTERQAVVEKTQIANLTAARLLAERFFSVFRAGDAVMAHAAKLLAGGEGWNIQDSIEETKALMAEFPELSYVLAIDRNGILVGSTASPQPPRIDLSDRAYFKQHRAGADLLINERVIGRSTGKSVMPLSRALRDADGRFNGVLFAAVESAAIDGLLMSASPNRGAASALFRVDGTLLARNPPEKVGQSFAGAELFSQLAKAPSGSFLLESGADDDEERLVGYAAVHDYPLVVTVSMQINDALADWRGHVVKLALLDALVVGAVLAFGLRDAKRVVELCHSNELFKLIAGTVNEVFWIGETEPRRVVYVSAAYEEIWQRSCASLYRDPQSFIEGIHPDDRDRFRQEVTDALAAGTRFASEFRVLRPDGSIRWVCGTGFPISNAKGRTHRYVGVIGDITARVRAEDELMALNSNLEAQIQQRTAEIRLAATVVEHTGEGILVTDSDALVLSVNPAFSQITGYSAEEMVGRNAGALRSYRHDEDFYREMERALLRQGRWEGELWNRRKDGEAFLERVSINAVKDKEGHVTHYVQVFNDITEARRKDDHIRHMAFHDALTGLPNRALLEDRLEQRILTARRVNARFGLLFFDLDRFKAVNDTIGHNVGDFLLNEVAHRVRASIRGADTLARLGSDEFVVLMSEVGHPEDCAILAQKIIRIVSEPMIIQGHAINIGACVGIAVYPEDGDDCTALMKSADTAMSVAKRAGRGVHRFFQATMFERASQRLKLECGLRHALANRELSFRYQAKVGARSRTVHGYEALLRWASPILGNVSPVDFIPIAEDAGLINDIGSWIIDEVCRQIAVWHAAGYGLKKVAINVSARQLQDGALVGQIVEATRRHGIPATALEVELTESAIMANPDEAAGILQALRALGVRVAIDDFGTGYSSLAYLRRLPIDVLKVDRSFVMDADKNDDDAEIVRTILALGKTLGLEVVAEGVETESQATLLEQAGCDLFQGYLFSRPLSAQSIERGWSGANPSKSHSGFQWSEA